jgi:hypothetical protein
MSQPGITGGERERIVAHGEVGVVELGRLVRGGSSRSNLRSGQTEMFPCFFLNNGEAPKGLEASFISNGGCTIYTKDPIKRKFYT